MFYSALKWSSRATFLHRILLVTVMPCMPLAELIDQKYQQMAARTYKSQVSYIINLLQHTSLPILQHRATYWQYIVLFHWIHTLDAMCPCHNIQDVIGQGKSHCLLRTWNTQFTSYFQWSIFFQIFVHNFCLIVRVDKWIEYFLVILTEMVSLTSDSFKLVEIKVDTLKYSCKRQAYSMHPHVCCHGNRHDECQYLLLRNLQRFHVVSHHLKFLFQFQNFPEIGQIKHTC